MSGERKAESGERRARVRAPFRIISRLLALGTGLSTLTCLSSTAGAMDTLICLNAQRAEFGLPPFKADPQLQARAEWAAYQRSLRGMNGHLKQHHVRGQEMPGSFGRWEGTARRNGRRRGPAGELWGPEDVYACYQSHTKATYAGCASVLGADGYWYYQVNYR